MKFEIIAETRKDQGTSASRRLRHAGRVPGVLYGEGGVAVAFHTDHKELFMGMRHEAFHSSVLTLKLDGKDEPVLLRDVQIHPVRVQIMHVDMQRVDPTHKIHVKVPLHFANADIAPGVKLQHGIVSHAYTEIEAVCLPGDLPEFIEVDLSALEMGQSIHASQIKLPQGVELVCLQRGEDPAVVSIPGGKKEEPEAAAA
jgi:large subunit ribosomal protein L25